MRNVTGLGLKTALITLLACGALIGCGDDSGDSPEAGEGGASGTTGGGGGTSGSDGGAGTSGGSGGTGGTGGSTGGAGGGLPMIMCTEELPTTPLTCGGSECPMPMGIMGFDTCQRPCCIEDACGVKGTIEGMETECTKPAEPDPSCPDYDYMGMAIEGCCIENQCGIISVIRGGGCFTTSQGIELPATPAACGGSTGDDAGAP